MLIELVAIFCPFLPGLLILFTFLYCFQFWRNDEFELFYGKFFVLPVISTVFSYFPEKNNFLRWISCPNWKTGDFVYWIAAPHTPETITQLRPIKKWLSESEVIHALVWTRETSLFAVSFQYRSTAQIDEACIWNAVRGIISIPFHSSKTLRRLYQRLFSVSFQYRSTA